MRQSNANRVRRCRCWQSAFDACRARVGRVYDRSMLKGRLIVESLKTGVDLEISDLCLVRLGRHDVSNSTTPFTEGRDAPGDAGGSVTGQPPVWTFLDFEAPDERAEELAQVLAAGLDSKLGWWADFIVADHHVVVFADRVFRYRIGDQKAREQAVAWGRATGTPEHQLDWGD